MLITALAGVISGLCPTVEASAQTPYSPIEPEVVDVDFEELEFVDDLPLRPVISPSLPRPVPYGWWLLTEAQREAFWAAVLEAQRRDGEFQCRESSVASGPPKALKAFDAVFNVPGVDGAPDPTGGIRARLRMLIDNTVAGERIRIAMYGWKEDCISDALVAALGRRVKIEVVLDGHQSEEHPEVRAKLEAATNMWGQKIRVVTCKSGDGCIGDFINHNKVATFSRVGPTSTIAASGPVVVVSSANLSNSHDVMWDNAVITSGDSDLYAAMGRYIDDLIKQVRNLNYYNSPNGYFRSPKGTTLYFSPRRASDGSTKPEHSTDTVAKVLTHLTYEPGCTVEIAQMYITNGRFPVADELVRIADQGCTVRIVTSRKFTDDDGQTVRGLGSDVRRRLTNPTPPPNSKNSSATIASRIQMKNYVDARSNIGGSVWVHSKYLIVKGRYGNDPGRTVVFTGSHNLSKNALRRGDETLIKVEDPGVSAAFRQNFNLMWSRAECTSSVLCSQ